MLDQPCPIRALESKGRSCQFGGSGVGWGGGSWGGVGAPEWGVTFGGAETLGLAHAQIL